MPIIEEYFFLEVTHEVETLSKQHNQQGVNKYQQVRTKPSNKECLYFSDIIKFIDHFFWVHSIEFLSSVS